MSLRLHVDSALAAGLELELPSGPARHVQVRRLQPGDALTLFDGRGGEWAAKVLQMGRQQVRVLVGAHDPVTREAALALTLALGMPANERMDWLVEKATELGVAAIRPLVTERSVLRLTGERAERKRAHWRAIAVAAAEQCGRTRVPLLHPVRALADADALPSPMQGWVLSFARGAAGPAALAGTGAAAAELLLLSGPEGGLTPAEEARALALGLQPLSLGPRVLRAETAPLVALAWLGTA
ncbi:MAG: 16S rRNA (uracil(1498)-N(3))-methyltransferase [Rubrivivax sp.]|nr:16S rRNA (uracil(1498)-N(3))-methyltransferase [Rubrivivax sp.]